MFSDFQDSCDLNTLRLQISFSIGPPRVFYAGKTLDATFLRRSWKSEFGSLKIKFENLS